MFADKIFSMNIHFVFRLSYIVGQPPTVMFATSQRASQCTVLLHVAEFLERYARGDGYTDSGWWWCYMVDGIVRVLAIEHRIHICIIQS